MTPRAFALVCGGLVVLRAALPAHPPALVDAHAALAAIVMLAFVGAPTPALLAAGLVTLGAVLSFTTSWDGWISLLALPVVIGPAALFCLGAGAPADLRRGLLAGAVLAGVLNTAVAFYQRLVSFPDALARAKELGLAPAQLETLAAARPLGLSLSPDLCCAISLAGGFAAAALAAELVGQPRAAALAFAFVSLAGAVVTRSTGGALALVAGALVATVLLPGGRRGALALGGAVAIGAVGVALRGLDRVLVSASERTENWGAALRAFADAPLFGHGLARFAPAYAVERLPGENVTRYAHGAWANSLVEVGAVGSLLALAAIVIAVRMAPRGREAWRGSRALVLGGAVALGVRALVDYDLQIGQTAALFALFWGLALAPVEVKPHVAQRAAVLLSAIAMMALAGLLVTRDGALRKKTADGEPALDPVGVSALADRFPFDIEAQLAAARVDLDALATCDGAACEPIEARARKRLDALVGREHPPSVAFLLRARLLQDLDDLPGALANVDGALKVDPGNEAAHRLGIAIVQQLGADDAARVEAAAKWGYAVE